MSTTTAHEIAVRTHPRALLAGSLGVFASFLAMAWSLFGYNLPGAVNVISAQSQNLMLVQVGLAFITFLGSGLMLARYSGVGGTINIIGALGTFLVGIYYTTGLAAAAEAHNLKSLTFHLSSFFSGAIAGTINLPVDRLVSTLMIVPVLPVALLLLISGLGGLTTYRPSRKT